MPTIDLGKIKLKWRGTYAGGTAHANWNYLAK